MSFKYTRRERNRAMDLNAAWRGEGVGGVITRHDAWQLTDGAVGAENDTSTVPLAAVALSFARFETKGAK